MGKGMRWILRLLSSLIILALLSGAGMAAWWNWATHPYGGNSVSEVISVTKGMTALQIAQELERRELIRNAWAFRYLASQQKADSKLSIGEYLISAQMSPQEIIQKLTAGPEVVALRITIPEGYTTAQIIAHLEGRGFGTKEEYKKILANDPLEYAFLQGIPAGETRLDGFLFPDTYFVDKQTTPRQIIDRMLSRFEKEVTPEVQARLKDMNLSLREWVTLASIVERETGKETDRAVIAGVFVNRLRIGMPLQSDATVAYALGTNKYIHSLEDIKVQSPYNTYANVGLPPGPIASPGHAALDAVVHFTKTDYLYFVAKKDGSSVFAKTHEEQLKNQRLYLK
jgi:UPF0755 protein